MFYKNQISDYKSLKDRVYSYLQDQILKGNIKPGGRIMEKEICLKLNVSRTPIREALMKLETEKFIQIIPHRGFIVKEITLEELEEMFTVIGCLEGIVAAISISKMKEHEFNMLNRAFEKMKSSLQKNNHREYIKWNLEFHEIYIKASGNKLIYEIIALLKKRFYEHSAKMRQLPEWEKKSMEGHQKILELLNKKDAKKVERYLREVHWGFKENLAFIKKAYHF